MVDWLIQRQQKCAQNVGEAVISFNQKMLSLNGGEESSSRLSGRSQLSFHHSTKKFVCANKGAKHIRESSPIDGKTAVPFTNVEGEGHEYVMFSRCSRTMRLIQTTNTKDCVSCGRAASLDSLTWKWLSRSQGCGVCGTALV
jgi:hypothetical protein